MRRTAGPATIAAHLVRRSVVSAAILAALSASAHPCEGAVELRGGVLSVTTAELEITFSGWNIQTLRNLLTNELYIARPGPGWLDVSVKDPTDTVLTHGRWELVTDGNQVVGRITATDSTRQATLTVGVDPSTGEVFYRLEAQSSRPGVRSIFWGLQGFNSATGKFVVPGQAGIAFDLQTTPSRLGLEYPTHWEAQFVEYLAAAGGLLMYARDPKPYFKRTIMTREFGTLDVGFEVFAMAPWRSATTVPVVEWRLKAFSGDWKKGVDWYKNWSRTAWPQREPDSRRDWARSIASVVRVDNPTASHLDVLAQTLIPARTLIYLVNWRQDSYDVNYPDYTPGPETAGFIGRAHQLGFRVMLHANALGVAPYHRAYGGLSQYQLRDPDTDEPIFWPWGLWPAGPPPPQYLASFAFISAAASEYRAQFLAAIAPAIRQLRPDGIHLDAGGVLLNDGNGLIDGLTSIEGMMRLTQDLARAFPELVLSYESMTETLASFYGIAQRWNADFPPHPVGTYLMGDVNWYGFLDQPNPDEPRFLTFITRYEGQGVMPSLRVNESSDLDANRPMTQMVLRMMRLWQQHGLRPDWSGDWTGLLFRSASSDGSHLGRVENHENRVRLLVDNEVVYERVRGVPAVRTQASIHGWTAYDGNTIYGLDPNREYWLLGAPWPARQIHLSELSTDVALGDASLAIGDYAVFELRRAPPKAFDFAQAFASARLGVIYNGKDYPLGYGAFAQQTRTLIDGSLKSPVLLMQPPTRVSGAVVYAEYDVDLTAAAGSATWLKFSAGMSDFAGNTDGALFVVRVNGSEIWRTEIPPGRLVPARLDVSRWAGQTATIRFIVHPGSRLNPASDLACWTDLAIEFDAANADTRFKIGVPPGSPEVSIGGTARMLDATGDERRAETALPARFAVFTRSLPVIDSGRSLLDFTPAIWRAGYGGWPMLGRVETSGVISTIASRGERERALATIPPTEGRTIASFGVRLGAGVTRLRLAAGLADPTPPLPPTVEYSHAKVTVRVNGKVMWNATLETNGWMNGSVDLSEWKGQNVVIELEADSLSNAVFDWVHWIQLTVE